MAELTRDWIALSFVNGVGRRTATNLIDRFGSPTAVFAASASQLEQAGASPAVADALKNDEPHSRAADELNRLEGIGGEVLTLADPRYPGLLRETYDPPIVLYCLGNVDAALEMPGVAVVGSRRCSTYGRNVSEMLARELASRGVAIVSGLARGIDTAAHAGALEVNGTTIAVMGTGLDDVYPKENRKLAERIARTGLIMTEFPCGSPPLPQNFPFRNRVISGISLGVLVIEGAERSGSLITARLANEQGRDVFAVPGNITSANSFGPNYMIKDGAKLVQTWRDIVEEFPRDLKTEILSREAGSDGSVQLSLDEVALSEAERKLLEVIRVDEPMHIDQLIETAQLGQGELMAALLNLEMLNRIKQLPGKTFVRKL